MNKETVSALQEFLRTIAMGEIIILSEVLGIIYLGINQELGTFVINWNVALAVFVGQNVFNLKMALLSASDKWFHKKGMSTFLDMKSLDSLKN